MTNLINSKLNRIQHQQEKLNAFSAAINVIEWLSQNNFLKNNEMTDEEIVEISQSYSYGHVTDEDVVGEMLQVDQILTSVSVDNFKSEFVEFCSYVATSDHSNKLQFVTVLRKTDKTITFSINGTERRVKLQESNNCEFAEFDGLTIKASNKKREIK